MFNASKSSKTSTKKFNPLEVVGLMKIENIQLPSRREIVNAMLSYAQGEELTDRELWILQEFGGDE